ncbi:hypothetical protein SAMN05216311_12298 [Chitinophaga sp. CF418]|nr:hypothetical protein SAMN05216311_12298 [Chitinophaga sp. CF418]
MTRSSLPGKASSGFSSPASCPTFVKKQDHEKYSGTPAGKGLAAGNK